MGSVGQSPPPGAEGSLFQRAEQLLPDAIFEVLRRYRADPSPNKINLGIGAYRDERGEPWVLPSVRMAEKAIAGCDHEYLTVAGFAPFREAAEKLVFHGSRALAEGRIASVQSLSGTGALLLAGLTLTRSNTGIRDIYITDPTWAPHHLIFTSQGFTVRTLPYYKDNGFDFDGYMAVLGAAAPHSAVVFHTCAHNPTGCDPSRAQWRDIGQLVKAKGLFPIFDSAYLGFNTGSVDEDAWALRHFVDDLDLEAAVCLSFSKNMGLYAERVGLCAYVARTPPQAAALFSILENAQRSTVSTPPAYGARLAAAVMDTPAIKAQWQADLETMSGRIAGMRRRLHEELVALETPGDWGHIVKATGMFAYLGIGLGQVEHLEATHHVYMASTGRISVAGLNEGNLGAFARALDQTVREGGRALPNQ